MLIIIIIVVILISIIYTYNDNSSTNDNHNNHNSSIISCSRWTCAPGLGARRSARLPDHSFHIYIYIYINDSNNNSNHNHNMCYCYYHYYHHHSFQTIPSRPFPPSRRRRSLGFVLDLEGARLPALHLDVVVLHLLELEVLFIVLYF